MPARYLWEAQALNMIKQPLVIGGSALLAVGVDTMVGGGFMAPVGAAIAGIGTALVFAGESIQVNPTTGERAMKATDKAVISTGLAVAGAMAGGTAVTLGDSVAIGAATSLAGGGMRYDDEGRSQGWSLLSSNGDFHGEQALLGAAVAAGSAYANGSLTGVGGAFEHSSKLDRALLSDVISTGMNVSAQYAAQQMWGAEHSGYEAMKHADLSRLGALGASLGIAGYEDAKAAKDAQQQYKLAMALAKQSNDQSKQEQAKWILMGLGYREEEVKGLLAYEAKTISKKDAAYLAWTALNPSLQVNEVQFWQLYNSLGENASMADIQDLVNRTAGKDVSIDWGTIGGKAQQVQGFDAMNQELQAQLQSMANLVKNVSAMPHVSGPAVSSSRWWDNSLEASSVQGREGGAVQGGPRAEGPGFMEMAEGLANLMNRFQTMQYAGAAKGLLDTIVTGSKSVDLLWQAKEVAKVLGQEIPPELEHASVTDLLELGQKQLYKDLRLNPENDFEKIVFTGSELGSMLLMPQGASAKIASKVSMLERVQGWFGALNKATDFSVGMMDMANVAREEQLLAPTLKAMTARLSANPVAWVDEIGSQAEKVLASEVAWTKPANWQGPATSKGTWVGQEGNSVFKLNDATAEAFGVPKGTQVSFVEGVPDLSPFARPTPAGTPGVFEVPGLKGFHEIDQPLIRKFLAEEAGISQAAVTRFLRANDLRMHHFRDITVQLVDRNIHQLHHTGGAAAIRGLE